MKEATIIHSDSAFLKQISIHASEKEATYAAEAKAIKEEISIHASKKEATQPFFRISKLFFISIHASKKEATICPSFMRFRIILFQSTPPRRRRQFPTTSGRKVGRFQSTPPRRRRRPLNFPPKCFTYFNPRLQEGGDPPAP